MLFTVYLSLLRMKNNDRDNVVQLMFWGLVNSLFPRRCSLLLSDIGTRYYKCKFVKNHKCKHFTLKCFASQIVTVVLQSL